MNSEHRCNTLLTKIEELLSGGITPDDRVIRYIDSTFLNPSLKEVEILLADQGNPDAQSLLQLLFSPDQTFQERLEDILQTGAFQKADETRIIDGLILKPPHAPLVLADRRGFLRLTMPRSCAKPFIKGLHMTKKLDPGVARTIDRCIPEKFRNRTRVHLRNARFDQTPGRTRFLCTFFETLGSPQVEFAEVEACLNVVFDLFHENQDRSGIFEGFSKKKKFYFRNVQMAETAERQRAANNPETLILQGKRLPCIDKADALRKMALIDRITLCVYGRTVYMNAGFPAADTGEYRQVDDIDAMIGWLS